SGSSAGSAAATAAGLVGFALGTETLGSIVSPSMRCGTTGLRPTFGRVARTGAMPLAWSMDKIGPICRTVEDTALVLAAINGGDPADPGSRTVPLSFDARAAVRGIKVGYDPAWFAGDAAHDLDRATLASLGELGLDLVKLQFPGLPYDGLMPILYAESAAAFEDLTLSDRDDLLVWQDPRAWPNIFRATRFLSAVDLVQADRLRRQVMDALDAVYQRVQVIISPSFSGPMLRASNFTGHPSLTLRVGFRQRAPAVKTADGAEPAPPFAAPHGITLYGQLFAEGTLCRVGMALEQRLNVWPRRPPVG
ncbi:MAG: amidase family protein, partial [Myxococcota bacterium]